MLLFMNRFSPPSSFLYSFLALSFPPFHLVQNSDIYVPIGTDADYVDTLIEYMVPVATVAVVLCLLFAISVGILLYFRSHINVQVSSTTNVIYYLFSTRHAPFTTPLFILSLTVPLSLGPCDCLTWQV